MTNSYSENLKYDTLHELRNEIESMYEDICSLNASAKNLGEIFAAELSDEDHSFDEIIRMSSRIESLLQEQHERLSKELQTLEQ